jgi:hypothetical protein
MVPLDWDDLFLETSHHKALGEFHQVNRDVRLRVHADLHDFTGLTRAHEQRFLWGVGKRSVILKVADRLDPLTPLIFRQPGL